MTHRTDRQRAPGKQLRINVDPELADLVADHAERHNRSLTAECVSALELIAHVEAIALCDDADAARELGTERLAEERAALEQRLVDIMAAITERPPAAAGLIRAVQAATSKAAMN